MKPLYLEFQAFGSYPGQESVDFTALARRGLFVVSGPTGSGKSTIFDAMVFALYGSLPGARSGGESECRSQHAPLEVETYVRLDFEVDGTMYRVVRRPTQERRAKRGGGTTNQPGEASLVRVVAGGLDPITTKLTNVTSACQDIIGLDAAQFQRVVLLPQGAFNAFLFAKEEDREKLLRPLFGGQVYGKVTEWLKNEVDRLNGVVGAIDIQIEHHLRNAASAIALVERSWGDGSTADDPDSSGTPRLIAVSEDDLFAGGDEVMQGVIGALVPLRTARSEALVAAQERARQADAAAATAEAAAELFDSATRVREELAGRLAEREAVTADEMRVEASLRARPVAAAATSVDAARTAVSRAEEQLDAINQQVADCFAALGRPCPEPSAPAVSAAIQSAAGELQADQELLAERDRATRIRDEAQAAVTREEAAMQAAEQAAVTQRERAGSVEAEVNRLTPLAAGVEARRLALEGMKRVLADRKKLVGARARLERATTASDAARSAYVTVMERFVATQAPRLAAELRDGAPCPVCGSSEHPAPARVGNDEAVGHEAVDAAREQWSGAQSQVTSAQTEIDGLVQSLGDDAEVDVETLEAAASAAADGFAEAQSAASRLTDQAALLDQLKRELIALDDHVTGQRTRLAVATGELGAASTTLTAATARCEHIDVDGMGRRSDAVQTLRRLDPALDSVFGGVIAARATLDERDATLRDALAASTYTNLADALAACLDSAEESRLSGRVSAWKERVTQLEAELDTYQRQGIPEQRPVTDALRGEADRLSAEAQEIASAFTTANDALASAQRSLDEARRVGEESAADRQQRDIARRVHRTCNGDAGIRVKLERWVLARELERVTAAGNVHLARMSNGRYRLERDASRGGLKLEVHDVHTGKSRATSSLSGGEQFQASLSLALGLADVVSHGGSTAGKQFEALFVDEGFGTLDQDVLAVAIDALEQIQAGGRMVGVITHVEEMKHRLHRGIEVMRLPDDAGSTLRVNP